MNENLRRGDIILYKVTNDDPQRKVIIVSRATKKRSKHGEYWYNVTNIETGEDLSVNLDAIVTWRKVNTNSNFS